MFHALTNKNNLQGMARIRFFLVFLMIGIIIPLAAQDEPSKSEINAMKKKAKSAVNRRDVYEAIGNYEGYFESGGFDENSAYQLGELYFATRNYSGAKYYYDTVLSLKPKKYPKAFYYRGIVCSNMQEYAIAVESFDAFRKANRGKRDKENLGRLARDFKASAEWALSRIDSVANIQVSHLGKSVNQPHIEFSPFPINQHELIYGSYLVDTTSKTPARRKLYTAVLSGGIWHASGELEGDFNSTEFHTGNAALSPDGLRMYFTRCRKNWQVNTICEIYRSVSVDGEWQSPEKLPYPINGENFTSTQPAVGVYDRTGADILYFISDRDEGKGGMDLWYAVYDKRAEAFKEPKNAGSAINTRADECCPFIDVANNSLYYSSKGHVGFGGFDIFQSNGSLRRWTKTTGLPQPLNSSYDDTYYTTLGGGDNGFFTSNRPGAYFMENGSCCDDIFYFKYNECRKVPVEGQVLNVTNYDIYDQLNEKYNLGLEYPPTNVPAAEVNVQLYLLQNNEQDEILISQTLTDTEGKFRFNLDMKRNYKMVVKNYGFFDKIIKFSTMDTDCDKTLDIGISTVSVLPEIKIRFNVYYEFDKSRLTSNARATIDTLLLPVFDLFPNAIIEIGSHTDHNGTDEYNLQLSQSRSESVVNYLIAKGISKDRLVAKGYGETQPIAPNSDPDGSDNPEGRQLNRRTELRVVGQMSTFYIDDE